MDEEVIKDLFDRATSLGYKKGIEDFKNLISNDNDVLQDNFNYVKENGYSKGIEDFSALIGIGQVKKKEDSEVTSQTADTVSPTQQVVEESTSVESLPEETPRVSKIEETGEYLAPSAYMPEGRKLVPVQKEPAAPLIEDNVDPTSPDFKFDVQEIQGASEFEQRPVITTEEKVKSIDSAILKSKADFATDISKNPITKKEIEDKQKEISDIDKDNVTGFLMGTSKDPFKNATSEIYNYLEKSEYKAVPDLNRTLNQNGFTFSEANVGTNAIKVSSLNGEEIVVDYGLTGSEKMRKFAADKIKDFVNKNRVENEILLDRKNKILKKDSRKKDVILNEIDLDSRKNDINESMSIFESDVKRFKNKRFELTRKAVEEKDPFKKQIIINEITKLQETEGNTLSEQGSRLGQNQEKLNELVGDYISFEEEKFTQLSSGLQTLWSGGATVIAGLADAVVSIAQIIDVPAYFDEELDDNWNELRDKIYEGKERIVENLQILGTTNEALNDLKQNSFWGGATLGLIESLPAMATGFTGLFAQKFASTEEEFRQMPGYKDLGAFEKFSYKTVVSMASAVLQKIGLDNAFKRTGILNKFLQEVLVDVPKDATALQVKNLFMIKAQDFAKRLSSGAAGEGLTGFTEQGVDITAKIIYNDFIKGKDLFETPNSIAEGLGEMFYSGAQELVGGGMISSLGAMNNAFSNGKVMDMPTKSFELYQKMIDDVNFKTFFTNSLKIKLAKGEITKEQAQKQLASYREAKSLLDKIPKGYTANQKKEAMSLLEEKTSLEKSVQGIAPDLVLPQTERIAELSEELKAVSGKTEAEYAEQNIQRLEDKKAELLEKNPDALDLPAKKGSDVTVGEVIESEIEANRKIIDKPVTLKEKAASLMDRAKGIFTKTDKAPATETIIPEGKQDTESYTADEVIEIGDDRIEEFVASQAEAKAQRSDDALQDTPLTVEGVRKIKAEGGRLFMTSDGKSGGYVTKDGYMGGLFKQPNSGRRGAAKVLQEARIKAGGKFFEAFGINQETGEGTTLEQIYIENGFRPVARMTFNPEIAPEGWEGTNLKSRPDNVFFVYDPNGDYKAGDGVRIENYNQAYELAKNQANETKTEAKPKAGNRLFNEPLKAVKEIADRYHERVFGKPRKEFQGTRELDVERAKRISDAFEAMKNDPNNPEVRRAYEALAKETIEQYKDFVEAGYAVEINNEEPYANSGEMIDDLRNNKKIKIFSTESGFGDNKITDKQRAENPLLARTEFTDVNGEPMLVNDLFRAIHDFYGHAELGNSFGPKGEENAWNVHARMFSPLARRAMTTETRGQNSWVNFSGANDKIKALREEARRLREEGAPEEQVQKIVDEIYEIGSFADQKIGLMPEEFTKLDEEIESEVESEEVQQEAEDLKSMIDSKGSKVDFRLKKQEDNQTRNDEAEDIVDEMNKIESNSKDINVEAESSESKIDVEELNKRTDNPLETVSLEVIDGVPAIFNITDQLTTGDVKNTFTGRIIDKLKGAIGFNGTKGNENSAWASVTEDKAKSAIKKAVETYNKNKEFFDDWWAKNPQYKGLVPMNIVKMGENGILSNEALGRVIADNMRKIPSSNKKRALNVFKLRLESQVKKIKSKPENKITKGDKDVLKVYEIIFSKNSFKSIEQIFNKEFYSSMPLPYRAIVVKNITTGSVNKPNQTIKGSKPISGTVAAELLDGQPDKNNLMFHLGTISDMISDNQLKNIDINNIVSIVGVDVINPGVLKSNHPNYPYSIKGKSIGILSNPVPLQNAYPTVWAKATSKVLEKIKKKQKVDINSLISQSTGVGIGIPNKEYVGIKYEENIKNLNKLLNFMNIAFPGVSVFTDSKSFDNIINSEGVKTYLKGDEIIYGVTVDGDIYINPEVHDSSSELFNTAIHEMGHVWTDYLKTTKKGREIYKRGAELVSKTEEFKKQLKIFNGDFDAAVNETMAILIGNKGQTISDSAINSKFKEWLIGVWQYVRDKFKMSKDITAEEIQDMTLDQFLGTAMADIFSGSEIKLTKVQQKNMKNLGAAFKKNQSMQSIIKEGRQNGFSDESIRVVLKDRGFKASDITSALEVNIDLVTLMPKEFGNIEGGALLGKKLFNETKQELDRFSKEGPRGGVGKTRTKTFSEIREKAMEIIKSNPIYKNQTKQVQMELLNSFDRALGIKTNAEVTSELKKVRARLREQKIGAKNLADAQRRMRIIIRKSIPKSKNYSNSSINKLMSIVNQTNEKNFKGKSELVLNEIEKQRGVIKNIIVDKIASIVKQKGKVTKTKSGKIRGKGVDAIGQSYFAQANKVLSLIKKNDLEGLMELQNEINQDVLSEIMDKIDRGEQITIKERILVDKQLAIDAFSDVMFMDLEQVEQLLEDVKLTRRESIARLNNRREIRRQQIQEIKDRFKGEIEKNHKQLYNEDGSLIGKNQSDAQKESIWNSFKNNGTYKALTDVYKKILKKRKYSVNSITKFMRNNISHLGTVTNILDRGTDGMFTKIFYNQLNDMSEKALAGTYDKFDVLNGMVSSLKKPKKEWRKWKLSLGEGVMKIQLFEKEGTKFERTINKDMGMRIYALSKNEIQRKKLESQGINEAQLEEIKTFIGEDNIAMADMVVDYLSNTYFDEVNDVYIQANDVSLRKVDNYFPTKTISKGSSAEAMVNGDFSKIFTAENAPALKDRVDVSGEVDLADSFTSVLENHLEQMERYKAYALGVKQMNEVLKLEDIQSVLRETGLGSLFNQHLNYAINPNSGPKVSDDFVSKIQRAFTGFALAFKPIQVLKQATSFVQAYEDYSYFPDKQVPVLDALGMAYDYAKVLARLPFEIKESKKISGTFRKRLEEGMKGDIQGLESGNRVFKKPSERKDKIGTLGRAFNISKGFFTSFGDILGVVGYKAVYNRNIKNGMSKDQAVRLFNNFNTTQQTRRDTEKIGMQQNANVFSRFFTMFGSTVFLQMNKVASSMNNIVKDIGRGQTPKAKDIRAFALNYSVANVLFTAASYSAVLLSGDDEEKQEAYSALLKAALGLNLIFQIPIIGAAAEVGFNKWTQSDSFKEFADENDIPLKKSKYTASDGVNPLISVYRKINKQIKKTEEGNEALAIGRVLFEIGVGAQIDTPLGIINAIGDVAKGEEIQDDDFYDALGISASYRPGYGTRESKPNKSKPKKLGM